MVTITFRDKSQTACRQVDAIVTEVSYHPSDVRRCGFTASIVEANSGCSYVPSSILHSVDVTETEATAAERLEKRLDPRIRVKVPISVTLPGRSLSARLINLSMSGALLDFEGASIPPELAVGSLLRLESHTPYGDISLNAKAEVIRLIGIGSPSKAGVRFIDMHNDVRYAIESTILREIYYQSLSRGH